MVHADSHRPTPQTTDYPESKRIGLVAGWGSYPLVIAESLRKAGFRTYCLGLIDHADPALAARCHEFRWIGIAKLGHAIRYFKQHRITEAVMAGKIHKTLLFRPGMWLRALPDFRTIRAAACHFLTRTKDCRDDTLLSTVVDEFAAEGIRFGPATDFATELLVQPGQLTRRGPSAWQAKDIDFGWRMAKQMGGLDVGQTVVVKDQAVLAVEAIEGTDECIRRAGTLCRAGGFTVVKVAKPQQDMRFDVPTVGLGTLRTMVESGGRVLAIEALRTIVLDQPEFADFANRHRLVVAALERPVPPSTTGPLRRPDRTAPPSRQPANNALDAPYSPDQAAPSMATDPRYQ